jgi:hypothetical protein
MQEVAVDFWRQIISLKLEDAILRAAIPEHGGTC